MSDTLLVDQSEGVLTVTLNRPEVLNAFNEQMLRELHEALRRAERDAAVRCVLLTGAGRGFCSGQDLRDRAGATAFSFRESLRNWYNPIIVAIRTIEKPVIAAVNGVAAGAGCSLALACDLRIASDKASFVEVFVNVGLVPDSGSTFFLPRLVGLCKAMELCFTGDKLPAAEALNLGLVNKVVPAEELMPAARDMAQRLAKLPTRAIGLTKRLLLRSFGSDLDAALEAEAFAQQTAALTADHREGVQAFFEK